MEGILSSNAQINCATVSITCHAFLLALTLNPTYPLQEGDVTLHWSVSPTKDADKTYFALTQTGTGWVALGFPSTPNQMVGAQAVIYTPGEANPVQVYSLVGKSVAQVLVTNDAFLIDDVEELAPESGVGFIFSRTADDSFDPNGSGAFLLAHHSTVTTLALHSARKGVDIDLGAGGLKGKSPVEAPAPEPVLVEEQEDEA